MAIRQVEHKTDRPGVFFIEIKKRGDSGLERCYYIRFKKGGKLIIEKAGRASDGMTVAKAANLRAAKIEGREATKQEVKAEKERTAQAEVNRPTLKRLWKIYREQKSEIKSARADKSRYEKYIEPTFGDKTPDEILPLDMDRVRLRLSKKKSPQTVKHVLALLGRIIKFGERKGLCTTLTFKLEFPRVSNLKTEDLDPAQLQKLLEAIEADKHPVAGPMMKMALFTGMRRGEMLKLKWSDVDFNRRFINIRGPKGGVDQQIPLNDSARALLESLPRSSVYVFPGRDGGQRVEVHRAVNAIRDAAGLPEDFRALHGLRHVYASMLASSGQVDLYTLQRLLTHKSPIMTQRYAHLRDDTLRKASDLAGKIIAEATPQKK